MAAPAQAGLPPFMTLVKGHVVRFTALDPLTGDLVANVNISNMSLSVDQEDTDFGGGAVPVSPALLPA